MTQGHRAVATFVDGRVGDAPLVLAAVAVSVAACTFLIGANAIDGLFKTIALLWAVAIAGTILLFRLASRLGDASLHRLVYVFALKMVIVVVLLFVGWVPMLDQRSAAFGYDPQRYYFEAEFLRQSGFDTRALPSLNYTGILYYYGGIFALFGHNPVAPALINMLLTLAGTAAVVRTGYALKPNRAPRDWTLGLAMIIPDVVWFDALTARETAAMSLLTIGVLGVGMHAISARRRLADLFLPMAALLALGLLRTSALLPVIASLGVIYLTTHMSLRRRAIAIALLVCCVAVLIIAPRLGQRIGSYSFDFRDVMNFAGRGSYSLEEHDWTDRSFGRLLLQRTPSQIVLLTPIRVLVYLVAPWPAVHINAEDLRAGMWSAWQSLMLACSALLYLAVLPYAFAALIDWLRGRAGKGVAVVHASLWVTLVAITVGNQMIHERYRVMAILLLWCAVWLGFSSGKHTIRVSYAVWIVCLVAGAAAFTIYKFAL